MYSEVEIYNKIIKIINNFNFVIRIDDKDPLRRFYSKDEKERYTNISFNYEYVNTHNSQIFYYEGLKLSKKEMEVHINYKQNYSTKIFDGFEKQFNNIKIDRNYKNEAYTINLVCDVETFNKFLHKIYPKESREIKLKRLSYD